MKGNSLTLTYDSFVPTDDYCIPLVNRRLENDVKLKLRKEDTTLAFLGSTAIVIGMIEEDRYFSQDNQSDIVSDAMRLTVLLLSVVSCFMVARRYKVLLQLLKVRQKLNDDDTLLTSKLYRVMLLEMAVNLVHCPPGLNTTFELETLRFSMTYSVDSMLCLVMLSRLYLIVRLFTQYSKFSQAKAEMILRWYGEEASTAFAVKAFIYENALVSIAFIFTFMSVIWSIFILLLERPDRYSDELCPGDECSVVTKSSLNSFPNSMWVVFVTTTTGKG
jgi:hypothetical protein